MEGGSTYRWRIKWGGMLLPQSRHAETAGAWRTPFPPLIPGLLCAWNAKSPTFVSDFLNPMDQNLARLLCPWNSAVFHLRIVKLELAKADSFKDVYCPWLQKSWRLCNLPCNISEATVKLQLYIIYTNLSWDECILLAARSLIIILYLL